MTTMFHGAHADGDAGPDAAERDAAKYATLVRGELADLSPEQVDELTDGLEADLAESTAEVGGSLFERLAHPPLMPLSYALRRGWHRRLAALDRPGSGACDRPSLSQIKPGASSRGLRS